MTLTRSSDPSNRSFSVVDEIYHKRKLDDYFGGHTDFVNKLKKHEVEAYRMPMSPKQNSISCRSGENNSGFNPYFSSSSSQYSSWNSRLWHQLQIFVRTISGETIVIQADKRDTVELLLHKIYLKTKIPVIEQRVIYRGKQLRNEHSLGYYSIEKDDTVQLVGRLRSSDLPVAWQVIDDIMYSILRVNKCENPRYDVNENIDKFFKMLPEDKDDDSVAKYFNILLDSSVPSALVMLYASSLGRYKSYAKGSINIFLSKCIALPKNQLSFVLPIMLEFCKLLREIYPEKKLYRTFRDAFGVMLVNFSNLDVSKYGVVSLGMQIFQFFTELTGLLMNDLVQNSWPSLVDCYTLFAFWQQLKNAIDSKGAYKIPREKDFLSQKYVVNVKLHLHRLLVTLLTTMDLCMCKIESLLSNKEVGNIETMYPSWSQYLAILKLINSMSDLYQSYKEQLDDMLHKHKIIFCFLIFKFAKRGDDHDYQWIFEHKNAINFMTRRHLVMLLFPVVNEDFNEMHEMLIDRSNLLAESFEYIANVSPEALHGGLFMEFKNEDATGPGVLREWFYLVCQEIFSPKNTLFLRSADDFRRFSPNPASKVDPLHLDYFRFTGRVIALAFMHKVQVGVLFDRVFYLLLAGKKISLEDTKDTDRMMYNSCKQILEMDPVDFDSASGLGLTFVLETEELGKRNAIELCEKGKSIAVNSENRNYYVDLLIKHRFAIPITKQVEYFSWGFTDMLLAPKPPISFFQKIYLEDLDGMLRGEEKPISIVDWEEHTEYTGFEKTERQICWFWQIMRKMTEEELRSILFFWTSIKFLPAEGFRGLSSKLYINKLHEADNRLPLSHTCFYRLSMPEYSTITLMERQLRFIAQDHVSSGFGKW